MITDLKQTADLMQKLIKVNESIASINALAQQIAAEDKRLRLSMSLDGVEQQQTFRINDHLAQFFGDGIPDIRMTETDSRHAPTNLYCDISESASLQILGILLFEKTTLKMKLETKILIALTH